MLFKYDHLKWMVNQLLTTYITTDHGIAYHLSGVFSKWSLSSRAQPTTWILSASTVSNWLAARVITNAIYS